MNSINQRRAELGFSAAVAGMLACWLLLFAAITGETILWVVSGFFLVCTLIVVCRMTRPDSALDAEKKRCDTFTAKHPRLWTFLTLAGILASAGSLLAFAFWIFQTI